MSHEDELVTKRIKSPANPRDPLEVWTNGKIRGVFKPEQPAFEGLPASASPNAPVEAGRGAWFFRNDGAGKSQFCVRFPSGAVQILASEP